MKIGSYVRLSSIRIFLLVIFIQSLVALGAHQFLSEGAEISKNELFDFALKLIIQEILKINYAVQPYDRSKADSNLE